VSIVPVAQGCVDQLTFNFSPGVATWSASYASPTSNQLAIQFGGPVLQPLTNVTYGGSSSVRTGNLTHVKSISVQSSSGAVNVTLGLDTQRPYTTSMTNSPPILTVSVG
jgi:hypothetical protein